MSDTDRFVGMITAVIFSVGGAALLFNKLKKLRPDAYHRSRYIKHRLVQHHGSCCCQKIQFTIEAPVSLDALDCESKIRYPHTCVPPSALNICIGEDQLGVFPTELNGSKANCYFCSCCGVHIYRILNECFCHVNIDLVDKSTVEKVSVSFYDGSLRPSFSYDHTSSSTSSEYSSSSSTSAASESFSASKQSEHASTSDHGNNQNTHSTNILAVQIYGAFADLNRENESNNVRQSSHLTSSSDRCYELPSSTSTPEKSSPQQPPSSSPSPSTTAKSASSSSSFSLNDDVNDKTSPAKPTNSSSSSRSTSPAFGGIVSGSSSISRSATDRSRHNYSPPSLEQLRKLANGK
jgi:hypothetical protein